MLDAFSYLVIKTTEEANEVGQVLGKIGVFGLLDSDPKKPINNLDHLVFELNDLEAMVQMLRAVAAQQYGEDVLNEAFAKHRNIDALLTKKAKVLSWAKRSVANGVLDPKAYDLLVTTFRPALCMARIRKDQPA